MLVWVLMKMYNGNTGKIAGVISFIKKSTDNLDRLLDIGCGAGGFTKNTFSFFILTTLKHHSL